MIDKKTEERIKSAKSFVEFWEKFHSIFNSTISKDIITKDDEVKFFETQAMIRGKYDELRSTMDYKYMPHGRITDPVKDILSLGSIRFISERNLKKMNDDWRDSYIFLNNIFERLKNNKRRLEQFNPVGVFLKRFFEK